MGMSVPSALVTRCAYHGTHYWADCKGCLAVHEVFRMYQALDNVRERLMNLGGFQRTERGGMYVKREDVLSLLQEEFDASAD